MKIQSVIFKDTFRWDPETRENVPYPAREQLGDFLETYNKKIISINYSVTHEGYNGAGIAQYCNHILLTYKN